MLGQGMSFEERYVKTMHYLNRLKNSFEYAVDNMKFKSAASIVDKDMWMNVAKYLGADPTSEESMVRVGMSEKSAFLLFTLCKGSEDMTLHGFKHTLSSLVWQVKGDVESLEGKSTP